MQNAIGSRAAGQGFALLEVLVTMVIILIGLLGLAGIMARSSSSEMESYQRVQAVIIVQDMIDRINANRKSATCYSDGATGRVVGLGFDPVATPPSCTTGTSAGEMAQAVDDITKWDAMLKGTAEAQGGTSFGAMIDARGCLTRIDAANNVYRVSVAWQGLASTAAPNDTCGQNQYTNEKLRRVVTMTVRIANLG